MPVAIEKSGDFPAVGGNFGDAVPAVPQIRPELRQRLRHWVAAADANDCDVLIADWRGRRCGDRGYGLGRRRLRRQMSGKRTQGPTFVQTSGANFQPEIFLDVLGEFHRQDRIQTEVEEARVVLYL